MKQDYENGVELARKMDEIMHQTGKDGAEALVSEVLGAEASEQEE